MEETAPLQVSIPYYSGREYLAIAIQSVLAQTCPDWRLTVFDDAGPEGDLRDWMQLHFPDPRISYIRHSINLGMAENWNAALLFGEARWVTLLHSDDALLPNYVELMQASAKKYPGASLLFCRAMVIDERGRKVFSLPDAIKSLLIPSRNQVVRLHGELAIASLLKGNFIMCPTVCYSRAHALKFDRRWKMVLDFDYYVRALRAGGTLVGIPEVAYAYRRHRASSTNRYTESLLRFEEEVAFYREMERSPDPIVSRVARRRWIVRLNLIYCALKDFISLRFTGCAKKVRFLLTRA